MDQLIYTTTLPDILNSSTVSLSCTGRIYCTGRTKLEVEHRHSCDRLSLTVFGTLPHTYSVSPVNDTRMRWRDNVNSQQPAYPTKPILVYVTVRVKHSYDDHLFIRKSLCNTVNPLQLGSPIISTVILILNYYSSCNNVTSSHWILDIIILVKTIPTSSQPPKCCRIIRKIPGSTNRTVTSLMMNPDVNKHSQPMSL